MVGFCEVCGCPLCTRHPEGVITWNDVLDEINPSEPITPSPKKE